MDPKTVKKLSDRLRHGTISGSAMLSTFRMLDESSRTSPSYSDSRYAPFYYMLVQEYPVKNVLELGFGIGICSGCYVRGCNVTENILAFQESGKNYYSSRIGIHNLKRYFKGSLNVYVGKILDEEFVESLQRHKWHLAIVNEDKNYDTLMSYLELVWGHIADSGTIVMDY